MSILSALEIIVGARNQKDVAKIDQFLLFGRVFGGAIAYPRAKGIWRDDENDGRLVKDNPVVLHSYMAPEAMEDAQNQASLGVFCRRMGRETNQVEVGLVIADEYLVITDFTEE